MTTGTIYRPYKTAQTLLTQQAKGLISKIRDYTCSNYVLQTKRKRKGSLLLYDNVIFNTFLRLMSSVNLSELHLNAVQS